MADKGELVLVRHGQSTDNELNLFSGWRDPKLTARGVEEAQEAGRRLKDEGFRFDVAFTSQLQRAKRSLELMLTAMDQKDITVIEHPSLNERHYGELSGLNKDKARSVWVPNRFGCGANPKTLFRRAAKASP